jgi:two-component system, chemotaxis family, CheB/CheR fusion protein
MGHMTSDQDSAAEKKPASKRGKRTRSSDAAKQSDPGEPIAVVGIGASAGGLQAFTRLLSALPPNTGMAFVLVPHLSPQHQSQLPQILSRSTAMPVAEVRDSPVILADHVYVIPPDRDILTCDHILSLRQRLPGSHHPIDLFFSTLAESHGHRSIAVVLSGTGNDGTLGLQAIKSAGGISFAQDESALHSDMPHNAVASGYVDFVLSPEQIAAEITRLASEPYIAAGEVAAPPLSEIEQILECVRSAIGVDFAQYKINTLQRRIHRRMALHKLPTPADYRAFLQQHPEEIKALYEDILISVTNFFRNPEAYEALQSTVLPKLFADHPKDEALRVWVLGCSTGEEAYSLAIILSEYAEQHNPPVRITIYATDLNDASIERARKGWYPRSILNDVSPQRLQRFFHELDEGFCVNKSIRELCIFARHNALSNPPFSRMDLVTCRNVLIYMEAALQQKLLAVIHYALQPEGVLLLGPSENINQQRELFDPIDAKHRIYTRRFLSRRASTSLPLASGAIVHASAREVRRIELPRDIHSDVQRDVERALLNRYVPAGVLVNAEADILQFRGDTGAYLTPAPGRASLNLFKMAREGLLMPLRSALQAAAQKNASVREQRVRVIGGDGASRDIQLSVVPVRSAAARERWYWVMFEPEANAAAPTAKSARKSRTRATSGSQRNDEDQDRLARLTQELVATREYLQSVIEQQDATNEELQSANEEVQSANEELQSINEELETSKEEIQSTNEELTTVNEELRTRNEELSRANDDFNNLFGSVQLAIVMVWRDLRIRRFTPSAGKQLKLIPADIGRHIGEVKLNLESLDLPQLLTQVMQSGAAIELEVQDRHRRWHLLRVRPYRTQDEAVDGALIVLLDIDSLKRGAELQERQGRLLQQVHEAIFTWEIDGGITYWNAGAESLYGYSAEQALGRSSRELLQVQGLPPATDTLEREGHWSGELRLRTRDGRELVADSIQVLIHEGPRRVVLETNRDVTRRRELEDALQQRIAELLRADRHKNEFLAMLAHELRNPLAPLRNALQILKLAPADPELGRKARSIIERQVENMARLVGDLLDAARATLGHVRLRPELLDLRTIAEHTVEQIRPEFVARHHQLTLTMPPQPLQLKGDATRLEQVLSNLLSNASKYTPEGGSIEVRLERAVSPQNPAAAEAVIHVRDNGEGIDAELLPRVFELFTQADHSLAHSRGGLGIGLHLVRTLVELHGGTVNAQSAGLGHGTEVIVRLPLQPAPTDRSRSESADSYEGPR